MTRKYQASRIVSAAAAKLLQLSALFGLTNLPIVAQAPLHSSPGVNRSKDTIDAFASNTASCRVKATHLIVLKGKNRETSTISNATTTKTLQGNAAKSRKLKAKVQEVWGNGDKPDPYIPNTPYRPNPPANQAIHPVTGNER